MERQGALSESEPEWFDLLRGVQFAMPGEQSDPVRLRDFTYLEWLTIANRRPVLTESELDTLWYRFIELPVSTVSMNAGPQERKA